ncbi:MAG: glycosyltransferase [Nannocystaceae bacterium]
MSSTIAWAASSSMLTWAVLVAATSGVAIHRAYLGRRPGSRPAPRAEPLASVLVVRPCAGLEPHLARSLRSTATLRYGGPLRVVLSTSTTNDPARPLLHQIAAELRRDGLDVSVEVVPPVGANLKASQLSGIIDLAREDVALVIDSDVELEGLDLDQMLTPLQDPHGRVAAVWCAPIEREPSSAGDRLSAAVLGGSLHAFSLLGSLDHQALVGKTFAVRIGALREAGGFGGLVQHLGEDMELARRLAFRGWSTKMGTAVVASLASGRRVRDVLARYARWLMVIRAQRPFLLLSYPLLLAATPMLLLAAALGWSMGMPAVGALVASLAVGSRLAVAVAARRLGGRTIDAWSVVVDVVLADLVLTAAFIRAALGPARVRWRQRSLRLGARGLLELG